MKHRQVGGKHEGRVMITGVGHDYRGLGHDDWMMTGRWV